MDASKEDNRWTPTFIEIEARFSEFVSTFRNGTKITDLVPSISPNTLNADFFIPKDKVIAELKCLESDSSEANLHAKRVAESFRHFGYSGSDLFGYLFRGDKMPERVAKRIFAIKSRTIIEAIKKANKQIRSTKILLNEPDANGLVLLANDQNFGFTPAQMIAVICKSFEVMPDCHTDCVVYFTPNVYHDLGDDVAHTLWVPIYNVGSEDFSSFVNEFGKAWGDFEETLGEPFVAREIGDDLYDKVALAKLVPELRKRSN